MSAGWGVPDPAAVEGSVLVKRNAFRRVCLTLEARKGLFASVPIAKLEQIKLQEHLDKIGTRNPNEPS